MQTRLKFIRVGRTKPQDIVLPGNASDETIVSAVGEAARKQHLRPDVSIVRNQHAQPLAFYIGGGRGGEGTITREWP